MSAADLIKVVKFPPFAFFLALILGFTAIQLYGIYAGAGEGEHIRHIEPIVKLDEGPYIRGSRVHITVKVVEEYHEGEGHEEGSEELDHEEAFREVEGAGVTVLVYGPGGEVFASMKGVTDHHGEVEFELYIGPESRPGIYTLIPKARIGKGPVVIGEDLGFEVV